MRFADDRTVGHHGVMRIPDIACVRWTYAVEPTHSRSVARCIGTPRREEESSND